MESKRNFRPVDAGLASRLRGRTGQNQGMKKGAPLIGRTPFLELYCQSFGVLPRGFGTFLGAFDIG